MKLKYSVDGRKVKKSALNHINKAIIFIMYTNLWSKDGNHYWYVIPESCEAYKSISSNFRTISEIKFVRVPSHIETEEGVSKFYKNYFNREKYIKKGATVGLGAAAAVGLMRGLRRREIVIK